MAGRMGPLPVTQVSLLTASIMMLVPAVMVFLSLAMKPTVALGEHRPGIGLHGHQHRESGRGDLGFLSIFWHRGNGVHAADRRVCLEVAQRRSLI